MRGIPRRGYTEFHMSHADANAAPTASWAQLERAVERIHAAARERTSASEFYELLLQEAVAVLAAKGGAVWQLQEGSLPKMICQCGDEGVGDELPPDIRESHVRRAFDRDAAEVQTAASNNAGLNYLYCPVERIESSDRTRQGRVAAVIELRLPAANPLARQGWVDFASTLADVASEFHVRDELRRLRAGAELRDQAIAILGRVQAPPTVTGAAYEVANEGRRLLDCDRLSVLLRRGRRWRLAAVSGVDRAAPRTEFTRRTEALADQIARWGEPLTSCGDAESPDLPPRLSVALGEHMDHSHARRLACAPFSFARGASSDQQSRTKRSRRSKGDVVLIAERFADANALANDGDLRQQVVELGELCVPALARTAELDRFPMRQAIRWTSWLKALRQPMAVLRTAAVVGAIATAVAALVFVQYELTVEAPATLHAAVERDVFATTTGTVAEIRVSHGQQVAAGEVLAVLEDQELSLKLQQVRGEIDAARQRLGSVVVSRTQRTLRENASGDEMPISAEQPQLEQRIAGLELQRELLERRREELVLRSPLAGQILTRDVQSLLESRPVERGEVLLTIADASSGWTLEADIAQRDIGHVLIAQDSGQQELPVEYRLAGDVQRHYPGRVISIDAAAPLDAGGLRDEPPTVKARIAIEGEPPTAARPGMMASVRIKCGERALGYVWLHDVGATLYRWATF
jgi:multidrug efflux pump subunit AcrA (membrane-fusion protein)